MHIIAVPDSLWDTLPVKTRKTLDEHRLPDAEAIAVDHEFRGRVKDGIRGKARPLVIKALNNGDVVNVRAAARAEASRLVADGVITSTEQKMAENYIISQLSGAVSVPRDSDGFRRYLLIAPRQYVRADVAAGSAWYAEIRRMLEPYKTERGIIHSALTRARDKHGLPPDLQAELDLMDESPTYVGDESSLSGSSTS
jgi:hypothetical protein